MPKCKKSEIKKPLFPFQFTLESPVPALRYPAPNYGKSLFGVRGQLRFLPAQE